MLLGTPNKVTVPCRPQWNSTGAELPDGDNKEIRADQKRQPRWEWFVLSQEGTASCSAGVTSRLWEIGDIIDVLEAWETAHHGE